MNVFPEELRYSDSHEWVRIEHDQTVTVGITHYAQSMLGDLVYVELPEMQQQLEAGDEVAVVESVKTAADVYTPITGEIIAVNDELDETPGAINEDPYGKGWLFRIKPKQIGQIDALMDAQKYQEKVAQ